MRERTLIYLLLALNIGLAVGFLLYAFSANRELPPVQTARPQSTREENWEVVRKEAPANKVARPVITNAPESAVSVAIPVPDPAPTMIATQAIVSHKPVTWREVASPAYGEYLRRLRAAGCPEDQVSRIVLTDIDQRFQEQRRQLATALDAPWWRPIEASRAQVGPQSEQTRALEAERRELIERWLGSDVPARTNQTALVWHVPLTGPVLGALPHERHNQVQEICLRSMERQRNYIWTRFAANQSLNPVEQARLRDQTRVDLRQVLAAAEWEEFMLRYSQNAEQLRAQLAGVDLKEEEFRQIFRELDSREHAMQLEFGSLEAMSLNQREQYSQQREAVLLRVLGPARFQAYRLANDPLFLQAHTTANQNGHPETVLPIYKVLKSGDALRQKMVEENKLTPEQQAAAFEELQAQQKRAIQKLLGVTNEPPKI